MCVLSVVSCQQQCINMPYADSHYLGAFLPLSIRNPARSGSPSAFSNGKLFEIDTLAIAPRFDQPHER